MWRLHTPSEGETKTREYCTPSEGGRRIRCMMREPVARGQAECDSATAPNRGICCRCGNGTEGQCRAEGLQKGRGDESHAATAPNRGICCRCGNGTEGQCRSEGLQKGRGDESHAATAPNRGICCRCGNGTNGREKQRTERRGNEQDRETMPKTENFYYFYG